MKVSSVSFYSVNKPLSVKSVPSFKAFFKKTPSYFLKEVLDADALPPQERQKEMRRLGEICHKTFPYSALYEECEGWPQSSANTDLAKVVLEAAVAEVQAHRNIIVDSINAINSKRYTDNRNLAWAKERLSSGFVDLVKVESITGISRKGVVPNGILLYGNDENSNNFLLEHVKKANVNFKEITFDKENPLNALNELFEVSEHTEKNYDFLKRRTLVHFKNVDELLTAEKTRSNKDIVNVFKQFMEQCSDNNHVTVLLTTTKNLRDFDAPSIGDHRFELKVGTKKLVTQQDEIKFKQDAAELDRLDEMAKQGAYIEASEKYKTDSMIRRKECDITFGVF